MGYFDVEARGNLVQIKGFKDLMASLKRADVELAAGLGAALTAAAEPMRADAERRARSIADDGTYASSIGLVMRKLGVSLVSTDPAAPVKEFARRGARTLTSKGTPLAQARLARKSGVGVPAGAPPRAMYAAVEDGVDAAVEATRAAVQAVLDGIRGER